MRECLVDEVEFITDVHYEESVWMKVRDVRGSSQLHFSTDLPKTTTDLHALLFPKPLTDNPQPFPYFLKLSTSSLLSFL